MAPRGHQTDILKGQKVNLWSLSLLSWRGLIESLVFEVIVGMIFSSILASWPVSRVGRNLPTESLTRGLPGCVVRRFSVCTRVPHRDGSSLSGPTLFDGGILQNQWGYYKKQSFCPSWESNQGPAAQGSVPYPVSYCFTSRYDKQVQSSQHVTPVSSVYHSHSDGL